MAGTRVFVYGTLLSGEANHALLAGARAAGPARTEPGWALLDLGAYPGLVRGEGVVEGEVWEVDAATLARLDRLEDAPRLYRRERIALAGGDEAEAYVLVAPPPAARRVPGGAWRGRRRGGGRPGWQAARWLLLRGVGLSALVAFASLWVQVHGLVGSRGVLPLAPRIAAAEARGVERLVAPPTLFWWTLPTDAALHAVCALGCLAALLLLLDVAPTLAALAVWALYLSLASVGDVFLSYQWDALLVEAALLAALVAPRRLRPGASDDGPPSRAGMLLVRLLVVRLMLLSGVVKLSSGDPTWRDLTALRYHHWTQPLPAPTSPALHDLPEAVHRATTAGVLAIELVLPLLALGPRLGRRAAFVGFAALQLGIAASGNYGFFNLLALALAATLVDDAGWRRLAPGALLRRGPLAAPSVAPAPHPLRRAALGAALAALAAVGLLEALAAVGLVRGRPWEEPATAVLERTSPFRSANAYGLFAVMTTERPELVVEGSDDGVRWRPYAFRWKPGPPERPPAFVAPHMPRLDWQMWFAALSRPDAPRSRFVAELCRRLLEGAEPVLALLADDPFGGRPPRLVRVTLWSYRFADAEARARGTWWERERLGTWLGPLALRDGRLVRVR